jgi:MFS family permease
VPAEFRHVWPERDVTRRVNRPWPTVERLLSDPELLPGCSVSLGACGALRLDGRIDPSSGGTRDQWSACGRVVGRGPRLVRFSRIDVVITPWSSDACELRVVPRSRFVHRWGERRLRRYWRLAHAAADALLSALMSEPRSERRGEQGAVADPNAAGVRAVRSRGRPRTRGLSGMGSLPNAPATDRTDAQARPEQRSTVAHGPWAGLVMVLTGLFMISVDVAIVNVASPQIERGLGVSGGGLVFVVSGYTLAYAMLVITGARLGDDHGHRRLFMIGLTGFTSASLVCGLAPNALTLVVARVAQGSSGAMMAPQALSIIQTQLSATDRARAVPLYATVLAVGAVVGQIVGGALVSADLFSWTWRPVFLINVPIGIAVLIATPRLLPPSRGVAPRRPDPVGVIVLSTTVLLIMVPLVFGPQQQWPAWTFITLAVGAVAVGCSVAHLYRQTRMGGDPLIDLAIFRSAGVRRGLGSLLAMQVAYGGFLFAFTLHLQGGLGKTPVTSGLTFAPFAGAFAVASLSHPRLPSRAQRWAPFLGLWALAVSYAALGALLRTGSGPGIAGALVLVVGGAGFGIGFSPMVGRTVANTPPRLAPDASSLISTTAQLGFAVGIATLGTYYLSVAGDRGTSAIALTHVTVAASCLAVVAAGLVGRPAAASLA